MGSRALMEDSAWCWTRFLIARFMSGVILDSISEWREWLCGAQVGRGQGIMLFPSISRPSISEWQPCEMEGDAAG